MSIPTPNLDDRTWQDIVEDAKKLIPAYCPQWTDFNPSDPGITLVELMAWMMEMLLYRLNRVPDKNFIMFMELLGIRLKTPRSASTWLVFDPVPGAPVDLLPQVPANTRVSGVDSDGNTIIFETQEPMNLNHSRLNFVVARIDELYRDCTPEIVLQRANLPIDLFDVHDEIPHALYLSDPDLAIAGNDYHFCILTGLDLVIDPLHTAWSYWDGLEWRPVVPTLDETAGFSKSGAIKFPELIDIAPLEFQGYTGYWLRVEISRYTGGPLPGFEQFKKFMEIKREAGIMPDNGFHSTPDIPFIPAILEAPFMPFGRDANPGNSFYIGSHVFADKGGHVNLQVTLADIYKPTPAAELPLLKTGWEYYSETGEWLMLGVSSPVGTLESSHQFIDRSEAFTHTGKVSFYIPPDMGKIELAGELNYWIRVTVKQGNYGEKKKLNPPVCRDILIQYKDKPKNFQRYIAYNDFIYSHIIPFRAPDELFVPFIPVNRRDPELFLGFQQPFTNKLHTIHFPLEPAKETEGTVEWEYYSKKDGWKRVHLVEDCTRDFTDRGLVSLMGPPDWEKHPQFGRPAYWLRLRWMGDKHRDLPRLKNLHLNATRAINAVSHKNEILGSGNGQSYQRFNFINSPILPGPRILVRELESDIREEIDNFKAHVAEEVIEEKDFGADGMTALWVVWQEQESLFFSHRDSRHYILDVYDGVITFGDGIMGKIPPIGTGNIKCEVYYTGGGTAGNMGIGTITSLEKPIPFIDRVTNPYPAVGGTDMETLDRAKLRTPWEIKHRDRAVTAEDFRHFALEATAEVSRVQVSTDDTGAVNILILPYPREGDAGKLTASPELCSRVKQYIDRFRLITTRTRVFGPTYMDFSLQVEVVLVPGQRHRAQQIRHKLAEDVRGFFHPLTGDMTGAGWEIGRPVYISELYYILEKDPSVDHVAKMTLNNQPAARNILIPAGAYPYAQEVAVSFVSE